jgi:uncharacterized delta-60 repeat protein
MNTNGFRNRFLRPSLSSSRRRHSGGIPASFRPRLEALEDRTLLSTGAPDPTFGIPGTGTATFFIPNADAKLNAIALQSDGKIVAVGSATINGVSEWAMERFNADGSLDTLFGGGAPVLTPFSGTDSEAFAVAIDRLSGNIWVAGRAGSIGTGAFGLAEYLPDGQLDRIGVPGKVTTTFGGDDAAFGLALDYQDSQSLGDPVVVGQSSSGGGDFALARYDILEQLDQRFGGGTGKVTTDFFNNSLDQANAVAIQPDHKIVVVGKTLYAGTGHTNDFALARYNPNGTPDINFGAGGIVTTDFFANYDEANSVTVQSDGKIVVVGEADDASGHKTLGLARYQPNGTLDPSFGQGGKVTIHITPTSDDIAKSVAIGPDGKIVVAGTSTTAQTKLFVVARYNPDGTLDRSFARVGLTEPVVTGTDNASGMALQPDGKIVVAGTTVVNGTDEFGLVRLQNDHLQFSAPTYSVGENGGAATITINRVGGTTGTVSAVVSTSNGSAKAGTDYTPVSTTVVFNSGETSKTITIPILSDGLVDGNETVNLALSNPSGAGIGNPASAVLTIVDAAPGKPVDVTPRLAVSLGKVHLDAATGKATQKVTIRNVGGEAVWGPLTLVLEGLKPKVKVRHRSGVTRHLAPIGSPFMTVVPGPADQLASQSMVIIVVRFSDPLDLPIRYRPLVVAGFGAV